MHEAGLARGVAKVLRERGLSVDEVRLAVRGGHHDAESFAQELRTYLADQLPDEAAAVRALEIRRLPVDHLCLVCGHIFESIATDALCPRCDGISLSAVTDEQIEVERLAVVTR